MNEECMAVLRMMLMCLLFTNMINLILITV